jgi:hypothetical protein
MRRPPFLEESGLVPPARGRRSANAARRSEMRWGRDVGLSRRQGIRLTRRQDEAWLATFAPEDRAEMERWLEPCDDDPAAAGRGPVSAERAERKSDEEGDAMPDR